MSKAGGEVARGIPCEWVHPAQSRLPRPNDAETMPLNSLVHEKSLGLVHEKSLGLVDHEFCE